MVAVLQGLCLHFQKINFEEHLLMVVMKLSCSLVTCNFTVIIIIIIIIVTKGKNITHGQYKSTRKAINDIRNDVATEGLVIKATSDYADK